MQDRDVRRIEERINEVRDLIKTLEEGIATVEKDLVRIYELQDLFRKCVEAGFNG